MGFSVDVQGVNTHFVQGITTANFGDGISVTNITVNTPTDSDDDAEHRSDSPRGRPHGYRRHRW